jgi:hypothetical protein
MKLTDIYIVMTNGFISDIPEEERAILLGEAIRNISTKTDFIVFDPDADTKGFEDDWRTFRIPVKTLPKKCYAKLDDYGSAEELGKQVGHPVKTQYALTLMLAEDY